MQSGRRRKAGRAHRRLGVTSQAPPMHEMDVHDREGPRQNGPRLPQTEPPPFDQPAKES